MGRLRSLSMVGLACVLLAAHPAAALNATLGAAKNATLVAAAPQAPG
jgi:hypothetical protein